MQRKLAKVGTDLTSRQVRNSCALRLSALISNLQLLERELESVSYAIQRRREVAAPQAVAALCTAVAQQLVHAGSAAATVRQVR